MKKIIFLTVIIFLSFLSFSQENSKINFGISYPFFFQNNFDDKTGGTHYMNLPRINVSIELPQLFKFRNNPNFNVSPGSCYFLFNECESSGGHGGGTSKELKHQALSLYTKFSYDIGLKSGKPNYFYAGILTGVYIYTKTTGIEDWFMLQEGSYLSGSMKVDRNGQPFFNLFYMGFFTGLNPLAKSNSFVKPIVELSFYPNYAIINDSNKRTQDQKVARSMAMISFTFGFGKKKATQINE